MASVTGLADLPPYPANLDFFCSELSRREEEPLYGTAVNAAIWLLLEYNGPWYAQATENNALPPSVQAWLQAQLRAVGSGRLQFIKQDLSRQTGFTFFVAAPCESEPRLYRFQLERYDDLFGLDLPAVVAGDSHGDGRYDQHHHADPLYLVCTNGRRDRCCALFGLSFYQALRQRVGAAAWQTTHLGGHRFAPTLMAFPAGNGYGRLNPGEVDAFLASQQRGDIDLDIWRGRTCYDAVTQTADYFLRQLTGQRHINRCRHLATRELDERRWSVHFLDPTTSQTHSIELLEEPRLIYASCDAVKAKPVMHYRFLSHETGNHAGV